MGEKRKHSDEIDNKKEKRQKQGFTVGPQNLPDGAWRRKNQKIKQSLIESAKTKKAYAKSKARMPDADVEDSIPIPASLALDQPAEPTTEPHPDRQTLIDKAEDEPQDGNEEVAAGKHRRRPKLAPFNREHAEGQRRKAEAEERRQARQQAQEDRERKIAEREKFRSAMAKARTGGRNGQRKLGRESQPLLDKVKRIMADSSR